MTATLLPLNQRYLEYLQQTYEFSPFQQRLIALSGESPSHWLLSLTGIAPPRLRAARAYRSQWA